MPLLVKKLLNKQSIVFDTGRFDDWCVYIIDNQGNKKPPLDTEYFSFFKKTAKEYSGLKVYNDFVKIYNATTKDIDKSVLSLIDGITITYLEKDREATEQWFTVVYAGMIAEENKKRAILKKRIKRLGMHQLLIEDFQPETAANFSKGKKWQVLDGLMALKGF